MTHKSKIISFIFSVDRQHFFFLLIWPSCPSLFTQCYKRLKRDETITRLLRHKIRQHKMAVFHKWSGIRNGDPGRYASLNHTHANSHKINAKRGRKRCLNIKLTKYMPYVSSEQFLAPLGWHSTMRNIISLHLFGRKIGVFQYPLLELEWIRPTCCQCINRNPSSQSPTELAFCDKLSTHHLYHSPNAVVVQSKKKC